MLQRTSTRTVAVLGREVGVMTFRDRNEAGEALAQALRDHTGRPNTLVLALPRGGVPVGRRVADALRLPLDVFIVRKLGVPGQEELAMGAVASGGVKVLNHRILNLVGVKPDQLDQAVKRETAELRRREQAYRGDRSLDALEGKSIILVDDGIATGATMQAAMRALYDSGIVHLVVAVPVASQEAVASLRPQCDALIALEVPELFYGVGQAYGDFSQLEDEEVIDALNRNFPRAV